ncbi:MAG: potassium transporter [Akkermansiaceae bacterium]|nr:potassium transporter [Akkermansiaceae bacterium]
MPLEQAFQYAFIYLGAIVAAVLLGKKLGLGAVLGYLIAGAAIGPWGFGWLGQEREQVAHFAEFGVVMMLFLIGLELEPAMLWRMRRAVFGQGALQIVLCSVAIGGLVMLAGFDWKSALALGMILSMSSTAIVLQTLEERGLRRTAAGQDSFAVLLFQDIAAIPMMVVLPFLGSGALANAGHGSSSKAWMAEFPSWAQGLVTIGAVVLVVGVSRVVMRRVFVAIAKTHQRDAFTGAALLLVIGVALLMTKVGLSPALGAFVAGVVLANNEYRHELESDLDPFKGILLGLFFLGVGAAIDFGYVSQKPGLVVGGAVALVAVKGLVLYGISWVRGAKCGPALIFSSALAAGGEFAFVLITLASSSHVFGDEVSRAAVAIVALSMATTPLLIVAAQKFTDRHQKPGKPEREPDVVDEGHPVIICGFGRFGHAVGRLVRFRGFGCTVLDHDSDQVELLRNLGIAVFYGDASRPEMLAVAGAARAKLIVVALRDSAVTLKIVKNVRKHHPHLKIYLRAHSRVEAYDYLDAGEELIYRETLDTSLRMGVDILEHLGVAPHLADQTARLYRERDEVMLRTIAKSRNAEKDSAKRLNAAREAVHTLDALMRADLEREAEEEAAKGDPDAFYQSLDNLRVATGGVSPTSDS